MFYGYTFILIAYALLDFRLGLSAWIIAALLTGGLGEAHLFLIYTPIIIFIYLFKLFEGREKLYKSSFAFYLIIFTFLAFTSTLVTGYWEYFHVLFLFILIFFSAHIITQQIINNRENIFLIGNAFVVSALIATVSSFLTSNEASRLGLGDNVRQLSNVVGMGIVLLTALYFYMSPPTRNKIVFRQYRLVNKIKWFIFFVLVAGLISTVSRGTMLAVSISVLALILFTFLESIKRLQFRTLVKWGIALAFVFYIGFTHGIGLLESLGFRTEVLIKRFTMEHIEGGTGIREQIWEAGISGLQGGQVLYGHGISSFRMLAMRKGYDFYAHSVFIDTLATTGLIGMGLLLLLMLNIVVKCFKYNNSAILSILVFSVFNYVTHGTMTSEGFWYSLAICAGSIEQQKMAARKRCQR